MNLGLRWDKNDGTDSAGNAVANDSGLSPRLALTFDPTGTSTWTVNASYGTYIAGLANSVADSGSNGGVSSTFQVPSISARRSTPTSTPRPRA